MHATGVPYFVPGTYNTIPTFVPGSPSETENRPDLVSLINRSGSTPSPDINVATKLEIPTLDFSFLQRQKSPEPPLTEPVPLSAKSLTNERFADFLGICSSPDVVAIGREMYPDASEVCFRGDVCTAEMLGAATDGFENLLGLHLVAPLRQREGLSFVLETYPDITGSLLLEIVRDHPTLESLTLTGVPNVTVQDVLAIARHCPNLHRLDLDDIPVSDADLAELLEAYQLLVSLSLGNCKNLTVEGYKTLASRGPGFARLSLGRCDVFLDPSVIATLFQSLTQVEWLSFEGFAQVDDSCIGALVAHAKELKECMLGWCEHLSSDAIGSMAAMPNLKSLRLSMVRPGSDASSRAAFREKGIKFTVYS